MRPTSLSSNSTLRVRSSTPPFFGGSAEDTAPALAVDPQGNLYVTGMTLSSDFPVTSGAFRSTVPAPLPNGLRTSSFLFKINSGGTVGYSTYFSTGETIPKAIAVDGAGGVYITGMTTGGLPVTPGAYQSTCDCGFRPSARAPYWDGFLARFDATGSKLVYATYVNAVGTIGTAIGTAIALANDGSAYVGGSFAVYWMNPTGTARLGQGNPKVNVLTMVRAADGSLYLAGPVMLGAGGFQPTAGAAQTDRNTVPVLAYQARVEQQSAIVKMDGLLQNTLAATYFGGPYLTSILSLALDASGKLLVGGSTAPRGLPTIAPLALGFGAQGTGFAAELSEDLSTILFASYFGDTSEFALRSVAPGSGGSLILGGATVVGIPEGNPARGTVWINRVAIAPPQRCASIPFAMQRAKRMTRFPRGNDRGARQRLRSRRAIIDRRANCETNVRDRAGIDSRAAHRTHR